VTYHAGESSAALHICWLPVKRVLYVYRMLSLVDILLQSFLDTGINGPEHWIYTIETQRTLRSLVAYHGLF
jgi:hypothetical protein